MLVGTERELAAKVAKALATGGSAEEIQALTEAWSTIFKQLFPHLVSKVQVQGVAPSGGGPITQGAIQ